MKFVSAHSLYSSELKTNSNSAESLATAKSNSKKLASSVTAPEIKVFSCGSPGNPKSIELRNNEVSLILVSGPVDKIIPEGILKPVTPELVKVAFDAWAN
ncbi:MAG: hypothetical protein BWY67_00894 [Bacteroidetes bacterium ADurb.Bin397]|nr:MAG: hypothetical protein BWY67_00894 [Bacteroidetes bacterium ADurb.Bin397]